MEITAKNGNWASAALVAKANVGCGRPPEFEAMSDWGAADDVNRASGPGVAMMTERRRARTGRAVTLLAISTGAVALTLAGPAGAEPGASAEGSVQPDAVFLQALDQVGVGHPSDPQAVGTANNVCQRILDGFSPAETVEDLEKANPGLQHPHAAAFVKVARTVYCPGVGVGELPGYPGRE